MGKDRASGGEGGQRELKVRETPVGKLPWAWGSKISEELLHSKVRRAEHLFQGEVRDCSFDTVLCTQVLEHATPLALMEQCTGCSSQVGRWC